MGERSTDLYQGRLRGPQRDQSIVATPVDLGYRGAICVPAPGARAFYWQDNSASTWEAWDVTRAKLTGFLLSLGIAVTAAGCADADQAVVSYTFFAEPGFSPEALVLEFYDGRRAWQLTGDDFRDRAGRRWDTREFETGTTGELVTSFWLVQDSDTLSSGELRIDLRADWSWNISFFREDTDPSATCFGCIGAAAHELAPVLQSVPADSLWLVWGGNSISDPVVF